MERFKRYQEAVSRVPTEWLVDCVLTPSDNMRQAEIDQITLEVTRRTWKGQDIMLCACPIASVLACSC